MIPQELLARRSPGYLPAVVRLDAVLDPGVAATDSSLPSAPHGLRPTWGDRPVSQNTDFSELCVRFRATPFTSLHSLLFLSSFQT